MALVEGCKHSLEITVPVADVETETGRAVAQIQSRVKLPGFRPGKAPLGLVKQRFAGDIRQEVLDKLVPRFFQAAVQKDNLQLVGQPNITDVHFHAGEPLRFKAEFEVAPEIELKEYRGLVITYREPEVTGPDIGTRLEEMREQKAEYVNEEPRPLADGDHALVSLESLSGVAEKISQDEITLKIGDEHTLAPFTENLRGAAPEESREFDVTYPEDYDRKNLAGKTVHFRATVKAVRRKELPELNDEFAKDLGDYKTLDELKEVPDAYVDRQIQMNLENQLRTFAAQGIDPRSIKLDWQKVRESQKERATRDVKASLLLDRIAEREAVGVTQEEIDREVQRIARQQREAVAVVRAKLQKDGTIGRIAGHIRTEKTLNFLFEQARKEAAK